MVTELQHRQSELQKKQKAQEALNAKIRAMESKLLIGGKSIIDHTNEQERELEKRRLKLLEEQVGQFVPSIKCILKVNLFCHLYVLSHS